MKILKIDGGSIADCSRPLYAAPATTACCAQCRLHSPKFSYECKHISMFVCSTHAFVQILNSTICANWFHCIFVVSFDARAALPLMQFVYVYVNIYIF